MRFIQLFPLVLILALFANLNGQIPAPRPPAPLNAEWQTKSFALQYADPEQMRSLFSGRSFVMEANRDLKVLTVHGSPLFVKEVEDAVKRYDVPNPPPPNIQVMVYLLTTAAQAPSGVGVPADLSAVVKESGAAGMKLADVQVLRIREGQPGQVTGLLAKTDGASLSRVWLQSAAVNPGAKGDKVSLYGLRVWLNIPASAPAAGAPAEQLRADPDVSADVDIDTNQAVMVSKVGVDKPVMVVVRASVIR